MSLEEGVSSKALLKDNIGRDPFRQFPDKFNSSLPSRELDNAIYVVCTTISNLPCLQETYNSEDVAL
jgi:hypothetical protein